MGRIAGAHGVRGLVRVQSFTEDPATLFALASLTDSSGQRVFRLTLKSWAKDVALASVEGVADRDAAEALRGARLFVDRNALPPLAEGQYYQADLVGLAVRCAATGETLGVVAGFHDYGAGAFLEIQPPAGPGFMLPFRAPFVGEVRVTEGFLLAQVPEGWRETGDKANDGEEG